MLFAASVQVKYRRKLRRIDVVVEAADPEQAKEKAIKQARHLYAPGKNAVYTILHMVDETEAMGGLTASATNEPAPPTGGAETTP